jgi:mycothione reductase
VVSMEEYDVLVVGSGSGMTIATNAVNSGFKTAVVEHGPMGGTCLNRGCIPSKMLIYPADVIAMIHAASELGIHATVGSIDFKGIMSRMHRAVDEDSRHQGLAVENASPRIKWYKDTGEFVSDHTMKTGGHLIRGEKVFIASGARPGIPPVKGLAHLNYLTSDTVLELQEQPKSMMIVGGGYIAAEYGHFFSSIGTEVTIIQRNLRLVPEEEPEVSELLKAEMNKRMSIFANHEVVEVREKDKVKSVVARDRETGTLHEFSAQALLVATGRVPNSDLLKPEKTGVKTDARGYIAVNDYLETSKKNIWAFGDAIGRQMFKHVANYEADIVWHNAVHDHKTAVDYSAVPHAVFTHPQIASVGLTETQATTRGHKILVGKERYRDTALGMAMGNPAGFVKVIVEQETGKILGGHIIGPHASILIQEVINAMSAEKSPATSVIRSMHIHPALPEVVQRAFGNLEEP